MKNNYDLIGIGVGPFNLSLAALIQKSELNIKFLEKAPEFSWHKEISFDDSLMQTSCFKDLVTSVDPTSKYSFLNYLVENGLFYSFMNTGRTVINRKEYEQYLNWVSNLLSSHIEFNQHVESINFSGEIFSIQTSTQEISASNICVATGMTPRIPEFAKKYIGSKVFHAKSKELSNLNVEGKNIVILGGGQTGVEIFRNILNSNFGNFNSIKLISNRPNLQPLDESPFTNEYFTPNYVNCFFGLDQTDKDTIVASQKLASDGNTPRYLDWLYNDLYQMKYVKGDERIMELRPDRKVENIEDLKSHYEISSFNYFTKKMEVTKADAIILCTGFEPKAPEALSPIKHLIPTDSLGRFYFNRDFSIKWEYERTHKIFAMNLSRHGHGISEPQTSLMPWRSATIINSLANKEIYKINNDKKNFINFCREE